MSLLKETEQVVYVEPNYVGDDNSYGSNIAKSPNPEDYSIVVDLNVEIKGRTHAISDNSGGRNISMTWQSNTNGDNISFMEGSRLYVNSDRTKYINSLTTNYTESGLDEVLNQSATNELFGIRSIDIQYNNMMIPEITIQFTDVRGVSLFAQEEYAHKIVNYGISATNDNSIEGSFFRAFFTFPYPKFSLTVKGFYGHPVSYELTCRDVRSSFDSNTGNYNVTASFIGYSFSFLQDIMVNSLVVAPYSKYIGAKYWDDNVANGRFSLKGPTGQTEEMVKLADIVKQINTIKKKTEEIISSGDASTLESDGIITSDERKALETSINNIQPIKNIYLSLKSVLNSNFIEDGNGSCKLVDKETTSYCFITDNYDSSTGNNIDVDETTEYIKSVKELTLNLINSINEYNKKASDEDRLPIPIFHTLGKVEDDISNKFTNKNLYTIYINKSNENFHGGRNTYMDKWTEGINSSIWVYIDNGLNDAINVMNGKLSQPSIELTDIENKIQQKVFKEVFNFTPTVENITKIIMAHCETYIQMLAQCSKNIINSGTNRRLSELGISQDNVGDVNSTNRDQILPPFPEITQIITQEGVRKRELAWIGDLVSDTSKVEEIAIVEGLLESINNTAVEIQKTVITTMSTNDSDESSINIRYPLSYYDLLLGKDDKAFGEIDTNGNYASILGNIAVRCISILATNTNIEDNLYEYGRMDANNFYLENINNNAINIFSNSLQTENINEDTALKILCGEVENTNNAWYSKIKTLCVKNNSKIRLNFGAISYIYSDSNKGDKEKLSDFSFVIKNLSWNKLLALENTKLGVDNDYSFKNCVVSAPVNNGGGFVLPNFFHSELGIKKYRELRNSLISRDLKFSPKMISSLKFEASDVEKAIPLTMIRTINGESINSTESFYNGNGEISNQVIFKSFNLNKVGMKNKSFFLNKDIISNEDLNVRAYNFLLHSFSIDNVTFNTYLHTIASAIPSFTYINNLNYLQICALAWNKENGIIKGDENYGGAWESSFNGFSYLAKRLASDFTTWVNESFININSNYAADSLDAMDFINELSTLSSYNGTEFNTLWAKYGDKLSDSYELSSDSNDNVIIVNKANDRLINLTNELLRVRAVFTTTSFTSYSSRVTNGFVESSKLKAYLNGFITEFKKMVKPTGNYANTTNSVSSPSNNSNDLKVGVYSNLKLLYDKWVASDIEMTRFTMETMFDEKDPTFYFIDSMYNKIGNSMYLNISELVQFIVDCQTKEGVTLLSLLSTMYSSNKFNFLVIQNFSDLSKSNLFKEMFTPISYVDMELPSNHPNFIVMYPYEASSKLDIEGSEYPDDSFDLSDSNTYPIMISSKQPGDLKIPAFGVSYGMQYQSYFTNISVDMTNPIATEQSIKAQFIISGANNGGQNNGARAYTIGQDLYTIYANNSYTCKVTMMGCAWVQPMMYFVLLNVPLFRGSYLIIKVTHHIEPGKMTTEIVGVRMSKRATRTVKNFLIGDTNESYSGVNDEVENFKHENSDITNNCQYAFFNPAEESGEDMSAELKDPVKNHMTTSQYNTIKDTKYANWTLLETIAAITLTEFQQCKTENEKDNVAAVIACIYNRRGCYGTNAYQTNIFTTGGWGYFASQRDSVKKMRQRMFDNVENHKDLWEIHKSLVEEIFKIGPYARLLNKKNLLTNKGITLQQIQKAIHTVGSSDNQKQFDESAKWGDPLFRLPNVGNYWHVISGNKSKQTINGFIPKHSTENSASLKENLAKSIILTLNETKAYSDIKYEYKVVGDSVRLRRANSISGGKETSVIFDVIHTTYSSYCNSVIWYIGENDVRSDAVYIEIEPKLNSTKTTYKFMAKDSNGSGEKLLVSKDEINESLRLSLIKKFANEGSDTPQKAKASFPALTKMEDELVTEIFELGQANNSILDCKNLEGYGTSVNTPYGEGGVYANGKINDWNVDDSIAWFKQYSIKGCGLCALYVKRGLSAGGFSSKIIPPGNANVMNSALTTIGFVLIDRGIHKAGKNETEYAFNKQLQIGDICVINDNNDATYKSGSGRPCHICMYCGPNIGWVSDFFQKAAKVYKNDKAQYWYLLRYNATDMAGGEKTAIYKKSGKKCV